MRKALACATVFAMTCASEAGAQGEVVFATCLSVREPQCQFLEAAELFDSDPACHRVYKSYYGRIAVFSSDLWNRGKIKIEVEARAGAASSVAPLYVEIVPLQWPGAQPCEDDLGYLVGTFTGSSGAGCGDFEHTGVIDISERVPLGAPYAIRLTFHNNHQWVTSSVFVDCIRVTSYPLGIEALAWGRAKSLYR